METRKIAIACCVGGMLCCGVAIAVSPTLWWLGILAGFAGGYISHEFREFLCAIPKAFCLAVETVAHPFSETWDSITAWLRKPHPFIYPGILCIPLVSLWVSKEFMTGGYVHPVVVYFVFLIVFLEAVALINLLVLALAFIGARWVEKKHWGSVFSSEPLPYTKLEALKQQGYKEMPMTYMNAFRWIGKGLGAILLFVCFISWMYLAWILLSAVWYLFKLVHSEKRLLCAIDGTLGGIISYCWLYSNSPALHEQVLVVVFGGLIGAALGIANWEIVSKRLLHVDVPVVRPT